MFNEKVFTAVNEGGYFGSLSLFSAEKVVPNIIKKCYIIGKRKNFLKQNTKRINLMLNGLMKMIFGTKTQR